MTDSIVSGDVEIKEGAYLGTGVITIQNINIGRYSIIGAGAVVTKSFPEGYCIIGGVPAQKIKMLEKEKCFSFKNRIEYNGYIRASSFEQYRKKKLKI